MITEKMPVEEILETNPEAAQIFLRWGLPCLTCGEPFWGTIEELAKQYHFDKLQDLLADLNR
ncbi:MAG: DUF1858 domain-containing protein [bacterium]